MRLLVAAILVALLLPAAAQAAPTARFTYTPPDPYTGEQVRFDGSSSTCDRTPCRFRYRDLGPDNSNATPNWMLRDYSTNPVATFTFNGAGTKNVQLTVRNSLGQTNSTKKAIVVKQGPRPTTPTDTDGDGVTDDVDQCVSDPGPASNNGCPVVSPPTDSDGDGVPDATDACPDTPAGTSVDATGCPIVTPPPSGSFPTPATTGTPAGWTPATTRTSDWTITQSGTYSDVRVDNANVYVMAPNVTLNRIQIRGGRLLNAQGDSCQGQGMVVQDSDILPPPGSSVPVTEPYVVGEGGYTLRRVEINNVGDGPRISYRPEGCGPVTIEDTFIRVTQAGHDVWHTDGFQAYYGDRLILRNTAMDCRGDSLGTSSCGFYPDQNNTSVDYDHVLMAGGAYTNRIGEPFREPGDFVIPYGQSTVSDLQIVNNSWIYGPNDSKCSVISSWTASLVNADWNTGNTTLVSNLPCTGDGGE